MWRFIRDEEGSLSVLIIGLFLLMMASIMVMTDLSAMIASKRALGQRTEYLVQQGAKSVDLDAYYQGRGGLLPYIAEKFIVDQSDPGIPLDCRKATDAILSAARGIGDGAFTNFDLTYFSCKNDTIEVHSQARAVLPFQFGFLRLDNPVITSYASSAPERRNGFWIRGFRLW